MIHNFMMRMVVLLGLCTLALPSSARIAHSASVHVPYLQAKAVLVVDRNTGKTLLSRNPDKAMPIASITKLMTGVVVMNSYLALHKPASITPADVDRIKHSRSRLPVGTTLPQSTLLKLALMSSENRAAFALSRQVRGGRKQFVVLMNKKARALGMRHTRFSDPTGLSPSNVSTARDLRRLMSAALQYKTLREYTTSKHSLINGSIAYVNSDALVRTDAWPIKLQKTGYTNEARACLVLVSRIKGHDVDIVILGAPTDRARYEDANAIKAWLERRLS